MPNFSWTKSDLEILKNNYRAMKDEEIAHLLGKKKEGVRKKRQRMGLLKEENRGKS